MDFEWDDATAALWDEVRRFTAEHHTAELSEQVYRTGTSHDPEFTRKLAERGWLGPDWGREGHVPLGPYEAYALRNELTRVDAPIYATSTATMVCNVIRLVGSPELQAKVIPPFLRGEITISLGMSEPEAGSDVASVRTRARREGDGWVIDGQKMFTTNAHVTDYAFLLTRTNPDAPKHAGLTMFLMPLDRPGIEIQPVFTLSGERTNVVFYSGVELEDEWRIGEIDRGWQALMIALQAEHSAPFSPHLARILAAAERWATAEDRLGDPDVQARLGRAATFLEVGELLELRTTWMEANGEVPPAAGPMAKLFSTEAIVEFTEDLAELVGPDALRSRLDPTAVEDGEIEHGLRFSLGTTIYAGTSEIQRNMIAQFACRLPRPG